MNKKNDSKSNKKNNNRLKKLYKQVLFLIKNILIIIIGNFLSLLIWRDKKYILFSVYFTNPFGQNQDYFIQNSKYFFLYLEKIKSEYIPVWITSNDNMINILRQKGFKHIYKRYSFKGIYYSLKSKYFISSFSQYPTSPIFAQRATRINLWHGTGFKKQGFDDKRMISASYKSLLKKIFLLLKENYHYYNSNCEYEKQCHMSGYGLNAEQVKVLGYPRLDSLYRDFDYQDLFMEKDYNKFLDLKNKNRKIALYAPTWRDSGKDVSEWLLSEKIKTFLSEYNISIVVKLHPMDVNKNKIKSSENVYIMDSDSDIYAVLKYVDFMIADYSSIYSDFLLLDRPIIFYPFDYEEYLKDCVELYRPYDEITPGIKVYSIEELIKAMSDVINDVDNYREERKKMRDELYKYQDGKNCERVLNWIRSMDK